MRGWLSAWAVRVVRLFVLPVFWVSIQYGISALHQYNHFNGEVRGHPIEASSTTRVSDSSSTSDYCRTAGVRSRKKFEELGPSRLARSEVKATELATWEGVSTNLKKTCCTSESDDRLLQPMTVLSISSSSRRSRNKPETCTTCG